MEPEGEGETIVEESSPLTTTSTTTTIVEDNQDQDINNDNDIDSGISNNNNDGVAMVPQDSNAEIDVNSPHYRDYLLLMEYKHLPDKIRGGGIYVLPSFDSLYVWHCAIFIRQGVYRSGIFRFAMTIPSSYPGAPPEVRFFTPVFHPLIGTDGLLDITHEFPDWKSQRHFLCHVLAYVKKVFYQLDLCTTVPPLNHDARALYASNRAAFLAKAEECVRSSTEHVFENPEGSSIRFSPFTKEMEGLRDSILERNTKKESLLAWVKQGVAGVSSLISFKY